MQEAHDADSTGLQPVKDDVLSHFVPTQSCAGGLAGTAHSRIFREKLKGFLQIANITNGLIFTPGFEGKAGDLSHIELCGSGDAEFRQLSLLS